MKISKYIEKKILYMQTFCFDLIVKEFTEKLYHFLPHLSAWNSPLCSKKNLALAFVHPLPGMSQSYSAWFSSAVSSLS